MWLEMGGTIELMLPHTAFRTPPRLMRADRLRVEHAQVVGRARRAMACVTAIQTTVTPGVIWVAG